MHLSTAGPRFGSNVGNGASDVDSGSGLFYQWSVTSRRTQDLVIGDIQSDYWRCRTTDKNSRLVKPLNAVIAVHVGEPCNQLIQPPDEVSRGRPGRRCWGCLAAAVSLRVLAVAGSLQKRLGLHLSRACSLAVFLCSLGCWRMRFCQWRGAPWAVCVSLREDPSLTRCHMARSSILACSTNGARMPR